MEDLPSLINLSGIIITLIPILDKLREAREKKKIGKEIFEKIDPIFEKTRKQFIEVVSDIFSVFGLILFLDHDEFKRMVDDIILKIDADIKKLHDTYLELFRTVGLYKDSLIKVLGTEKWSTIEPLVNMALYEKRIDFEKLEEMDYFNYIMEKIYGSPVNYIENHVKKNADLLREKLEPIMKKYGIDATKEINLVTKLLTQLPQILSMLKENPVLY